MSSIDGFVWIGRSYDSIDCGAAKSCSPPPTRRAGSCFVHEAERRGVSRKIPAYPKGAQVRGGLVNLGTGADGNANPKGQRTRVFLAHHDGTSTPAKGKIFGYFELQRFESIRTSAPKESTAPGGMAWREAGTRSKTSDHACPETDDLDELITAIVDEVLDDLLGGELGGEPTWCPVELEVKTQERSCLTGTPPTGWRDEPDTAAVYVVDLLAAAIAEAWARVVACAKGQPTGESEWRTVQSRVEQGLRRRKPTKIPPSLSGKARRRGRLVLFDSPPDWEAYPTAAFRTMAHIDGEHLLEQIGQANTVRVRHVAPRPSRADVVSRLACQCGTNLKFADSFLGGLFEIAERHGVIDGKRFTFSRLEDLRRWIDPGRRPRIEDPQIDELTRAIVARDPRLTTDAHNLAHRCRSLLDELSEPTA